MTCLYGGESYVKVSAQDMIASFTTLNHNVFLNSDQVFWTRKRLSAANIQQSLENERRLLSDVEAVSTYFRLQQMNRAIKMGSIFNSNILRLIDVVSQTSLGWNKSCAAISANETYKRHLLYACDEGRDPLRTAVGRSSHTGMFMNHSCTHE